MSDGLVVFPLDVDRGYAGKFKPHIHRDNLDYEEVSFIFTMSKDNQVADTDYTPLTFSAGLTLGASSGADSVSVDDVWGFGISRTAIIQEGATSENVVIKSINADSNTVTFTSNLANSYTDAATLSMDRVTVSYSNKVTTVEYVVAGQNADSSLAGADVQKAVITAGQSGGVNTFHDFDKLVCYPVLPVWDGSQFVEGFGGYLVRERRMLKGMKSIIINSDESAVAIDPDIFIRAAFTSSEDTPTQKLIDVFLSEWRS